MVRADAKIDSDSLVLFIVVILHVVCYCCLDQVSERPERADLFRDLLNGTHLVKVQS